MSYFLCKTSDIDDPGSAGFEVNTTKQGCAVFVVHKNGQFFAYYNSCPHTGVTLEWQENRFLDPDGALIQCATHDALFTIDTGECIHGPCTGRFLQALPLIITNDDIYLDI